MSQFEVIRDINETMKELLKDAFKEKGFTTVTVSTDRPKKDNIKNYHANQSTCRGRMVHGYGIILC